LTPVRWFVSTRNPLLRFALTPLAGLPGGLAPAVAAFVVRKWITGEGFDDASLEWNLKSKWPYYLFAWLSPLAVAFGIALLGLVTGQRHPDYSLCVASEVLASDATLSFGDIEHPSLIIGVELVLISLLSMIILLGEEFGWRGYLQVRLLRDRPLPAAVATGLIWGIWHYPLYFRPSCSQGVHCTYLLVFPVSTILLSVIFSWLRQRTGSVWSASLAHASANYLGANLVSLWFVRESPDVVTWSYLGIAGWAPLGAICAWLVLGRRLESV